MKLNYPIMKKPIIILILTILFRVGIAQGIDDFVICHDARKSISCITNDDFVLQFNNGLFTGFKTFDDIVKMNESSKEFTIKNVAPRNTNDSFVVLQLTPEGLRLRNRDSVILLNKTGGSIESNLESAIVDFFNFFVYLEYSEGYLDQITFNASSVKITISIYWYKDRYYWDIKGVSETSSLVIDYRFSKPESIILRDDHLRKGISLNAKKNRRFFRLLMLYNIGSTDVSIPIRKIFYKNTGIVNTRKTGMPIDECGCNN